MTSQESDLAAFEAAEQRLTELERRMFGQDKKQNEMCGVVVPKVASMAQEVGDAIGKHERIVPLFRRLNELEKYLEPSAATETGLSLEARAELVLNEEDRLRKINATLEIIKEKKSVLDSETLKHVPSLEGKLLELTKIHLDQSQRCDEWSEEALGHVEQYNEVIDAITKTFIEYDKVLSAAEEACNAK